ncbi:MAG: DUF6709 family protein [Lachnospiraceae bacterium]
MKYRKLFNQIRKVNAFKLILPVVILILLIVTADLTSMWEGLFPVNLGSDQNLATHYGNGYRYVQVTVPKLYYSGYDYMQGSSVKGHYFYSLDNGKCRIYILDKFSDEVPDSLEEYTVTGKLIFQPDNYNDLLALMARDLGWTKEGISSVTMDVILSRADYHNVLMLIMAVFMLLALVFVIASILTLIFNIVRPDYAYTFYSLGHHKERRFNILRAAREFETALIFESDTIFITARYFIYITNFNAAIIPLKDIVWMYKHSTYYNVLVVSWLSYTLRVITRNNHRYKFRGNDKEVVDELLKFLKELDLGIMLGYTPENVDEYNRIKNNE